jgi:peroxiredoxin
MRAGEHMADSRIPEVGTIPTSFTLPDEDGNLVSLGELAAQSGLVLLFYRGLW